MSRNRIRVIDESSPVETGTVSEDRLLELLGSAFGPTHIWDGVLAVYTDKVEWSVSDGLDASHLGNLLELRAYAADSELHAIRGVLGKDFVWRKVCDTTTVADGRKYDAYFDELQYLDIDSTKSSGFNYVTTGGGAYTLPVKDAERILVRNYLVYGEDDGMARIVDFRIVALKGENDV